MISFSSDYIAGMHPEILKRITETNLICQEGYGADVYCEMAVDKIKEACGVPDGEVHFLVGGTQVNQFVISTMLKPYEGVVAANSGHISLHEGGAIEYTGHKVLELPGENGKITAEQIDQYLENFFADSNHEHMVIPGMVYLTFPTEYGTLYSKKELHDIYAVCQNYHLPLYIDGARLGYGLASPQNDMTLKEFASLCDVFYIGGTKVGAMFGEAVVYTHGNAPKYFLTQLKQHGALLAKGRFLGLQFDTLFTDDLYLTISKHAIDMAEQLKELFLQKGYQLFLDSPTNQQFIILNNDKMEELKKQVSFSFWEKYDENNSVVRFATSWSTTKEDLDLLSKII